MVKKYRLALGLFLFAVIGTAQAQSNAFEFPDNKCVSEDVVYLEEKPAENSKAGGQLQLFAVKKQKDDRTWKIKDAFLEEAAAYRPLDTDIKGENPSNWEFKSKHVVSRFNFGVRDKKVVYKKYCVEFQEEIPVGPNGELAQSIGGDSGIDLIKNYVAMIYKVGVTLLGLVCVLIMVVSGIQISAGGLDSGAVDSAKGRIAQALFSLVLLFASAMILKAINPGFFL